MVDRKFAVTGTWASASSRWPRTAESAGMLLAAARQLQNPLEPGRLGGRRVPPYLSSARLEWEWVSLGGDLAPDWLLDTHNAYPIKGGCQEAGESSGSGIWQCIVGKAAAPGTGRSQ